VFSITQDHQGVMWIATQDGLNRYDGRTFKQYRHKDNDPHSLANNYVRKVFVDNAGILWVGTQNGLSRYNADYDNFDNFYHHPNETTGLADNKIWEIYQDHNDRLWVSTTEGVHFFQPKQQSFKRLIINNIDTKLKEVKTIFEDESGKFWFGTYDQGIYLANSELSFGTLLKQPNSWHIQIDANALYEIKAIEHNYWLATDNGIFVVSRDYRLISHYTQASTNHQLLSDTIRSIALAENGNVWIATPNGLNIISLMDESIQQITASNHPSLLGENWIYKIFKDSNNDFWLGTLGKGLFVHKTNYDVFKHYIADDLTAINGIVQFDGDIWIVQNKNLTNLSTSKSITLPFAIKKILNIESNRILVLSVENIFYHIKIAANGDIEILNKLQLPLPNNQTGNIVYKDGFIYFINADKQLLQFDYISKKFNQIIIGDAYYISGIHHFEIINNFIWLLTENNELIQLSIDNFTITQKLDLQAVIPHEKVIKFLLRDSYVLFSTTQELLLFNYKNKKKSVFNESNGLRNSFINSVVFDKQNNLWLATNKGISLITANNQSILNYYEDFLLNDNEFITDSALVTTKNQVLFGGLNGFHLFNPEQVLALTTKIPTPIISELLIANKPVPIQPPRNVNAAQVDKALIQQVDEQLFLSQHINSLNKITLTYEQSLFSLEFIAPNAKLPEQISYQYRLRGYNNQWIDAGENNYRATYTNLDAGDYIFEIKAFDRYQPSNAAVKQLTIKILPPWWLSPLAYAGYSFLVLLIIGYFILQLYHRRQFHLQIQQSEERLKLSLWGSGDEMWDWNIPEQKIFRSNIWGDIGFPTDGMRATNEKSATVNFPTKSKNQGNIHPRDLPKVQQALAQVLTEGEESFEASYRVRNNQGKWVWLLDRGKVVERDTQQNPVRITGTLKDITKLKKAEERLRLFAKSIENISDAVAIFNEHFITIEVNRAYEKITGLSKKQALRQPFDFSQYPASYTESVKQQVKTHGRWHNEIESKRANGEIYQADINIDVIRDEEGRISHYVSVFSDISERKAKEEELRKLANSDTLTELPNRSYFQAKHEHLVKFKTPHALLVFDLDNFKKINDSLGHEIGDKLLCQVAERIVKSARGQDTVCRLGGDEFSLIIENTNDVHAIGSIAKNILEQIKQPLKLSTTQEVVLHSSIGIVIYPEDGTSPQELLKNADTAMYHAKNTGGNRYQFFNNSMNKEAVKRLQVENLIRYGIKEDYFSVYYQPKIDLKTGAVAGMEALVRFEHPKKGIISPAVFIPVSEETGQIIEIGEIVLRKACIETKRWLDAGLFTGRVAVNLSAVQFTQPNLVEVIQQILQETQLPAKHLELEITEGTVMDSPQRAIDIMKQIRAMGIHLSLDDFGTGYSSLAYLKRFPLNTLKIDKAFVDDIEVSEQGRNMVATIVTIAHNLGLSVVAEGVEHENQLIFLSQLKCEQLQGYLYSKPLCAKDFYQYIVSQRITAKSTSFLS
jgi:diguanylate cyclase (GGDEF)-like protein/PAS domain S-box-containing protein